MNNLCIFIFFSDISENDLSVICSRLWDLDENRCEPGVYYQLDMQGDMSLL